MAMGLLMTDKVLIYLPLVTLICAFIKLSHEYEARLIHGKRNNESVHLCGIICCHILIWNLCTTQLFLLLSFYCKGASTVSPRMFQIEKSGLLDDLVWDIMRSVN